MSEELKKLFSRYIADLGAIKTLYNDGFLDETEADNLKIELLDEIVDTLKEEVVEPNGNINSNNAGTN